MNFAVFMAASFGPVNLAYGVDVNRLAQVRAAPISLRARASCASVARVARCRAPPRRRPVQNCPGQFADYTAFMNQVRETLDAGMPVWLGKYRARGADACLEPRRWTRRTVCEGLRILL